MSNTVRQLLRAVQQTEVFSVNPQDTAFDVLHLMIKKNISAVLVVENEKLVGIVSERDLCRRVLLHEKGLTTPVKEFMTANPEFVSPNAVLEDCEKLMAELNVRHLPVVEKGKVIGIISIKDILVVTRRDSELLAMQYESYIGGRG